MYTTMPHSSLAIPSQFPDVREGGVGPAIPCSERNPSGLVLFQPTDEPAPEGLPSLGVSTASPTHRSTLQERREKLLGGSLLSLCVENLQSDCQGSSERDCDGTTVVFRGWSKTVLGNPSEAQPKCGTVRLVSYNILAQRFLSMQHYPRCPPFALAEDYRSGFTEQELLQAKPDIILLQEISGDVFEKPGLLGENLQKKHGFNGNRVVVTDMLGRPRHGSAGATVNAVQGAAAQEDGSPSTKPLSTGVTGCDRFCADGTETHGKAERSDLEGVATFYLRDRFELVDVIPIRFNEIASADKTLTQSEQRSVRRSSHNVALITVLRDVNKPNVIYIVCNLHLLWGGSQCQLWQLHRLMNYIEQIKEEHENNPGNSCEGQPIVAVMLGGDFNSEPGEPPIAYALNCAFPESTDIGASWGTFSVETGTCSSDSRDVEDDVMNSKPGTPSTASPCAAVGNCRSGYANLGVGHSLTLADVYETYRERHPHRVSFVDPMDGGKGKVYDHILIDKRYLTCTDVLRLSSSMNLPASNCPSDHCPVGAIIVPLGTFT